MGKGNKNKHRNQATQTLPPATEIQTQTAPAAPETVTELATQEPTVEVIEGGKKKRIPMARVFTAPGIVAIITASVDSVKTYVQGFMGLNVGARKGYDNYWAKADGFTNPESIMKLTPQGIGKMLAILHHRAALYIAEGGEDGAEVIAVLDGIRQYETIAVTEAKEVARQKLFNDALAMMTKAFGGDEKKAREALAQHAHAAPKPQAATVQHTEPTIGEAGATLDTAEDTAESVENELEDANA